MAVANIKDRNKDRRLEKLVIVEDYSILGNPRKLTEKEKYHLREVGKNILHNIEFVSSAEELEKSGFSLFYVPKKKPISVAYRYVPTHKVYNARKVKHIHISRI